MKLSVGKLARMFKISRTTLLYYDSIGLLRPSGRSQAGYRLYNETDLEKLKQIMLYREIGVPLNEIPGLILATECDVVAILLKRLGELNREIFQIKNQQEIIVRILKDTDFNMQFIDHSVWKNILDKAGIDEKTAKKFHAEFEKHSPEQHHKLLGVLGLTEEEIRRIVISLV